MFPIVSLGIDMREEVEKLIDKELSGMIDRGYTLMFSFGL